MSKVTALRMGKGRKKRVNVLLDGKFAFSLDTEVVVKEGLRVGQELSESQIEGLSRSDQFHRCLDAAAHYLSYRPRSEAELRMRLQQRGFDGEGIEAAMARLKEQGLVDDVAFAQFWKDNREAFSPRSQWLTKVELKRKGVSGDIINQVVDVMDDSDSAYRAAKNKIRALPSSDYQSFRRRLAGYLKRRGFGYEIINQAVEQLWQEQGEKI